MRIERITYHAKHGVMTQKINAIMHISTHVNAPIHLIPGGKGVGEIGWTRSSARACDPRHPEEEVGADRAAADLEKATPAIEEDDIVIINTRWHRRYSDSQEYFGHAPGLSKASGRMAGEEEGEARRRRHRDGRSSARDLARPASQRPADQGPAASNTRTRPARTRRRISPIGTSRIRRSSRRTSRPSRMSAAISTK